jgi:tetratricopeptide (TPR) repeat protein
VKYIAGLFSFLFITSLLTAQEKEPLEKIHSMLLNDEYRLLLEYTGQIVAPDGPVPASTDSARTCLPDSQMAKVFYYRGTAYRELSILDSSLQSYDLACRLDTVNLAYLKARGLALHRLGRIKDAIEVYEQVVLTDSSDRKSLGDLAALYSLRREYTKSLSLYRQLLERDSLNYFFLKQSGKCHLELNRTDSALLCFKKAFKLNPADVYLTQQITNLYLKKKDLENALFSIQAGFVYDTSNLDLLKLRGYLWLLSGEYQRAVWDLENARDQDSSSVFIQKYLGLSYHEEKRFDEARKALLLAFKLDSTDAETAYFLGNSCRWSKFEDEGVLYFKKAIELQQPDPVEIKNVYIQLGELLKVLHRFDEALESYAQAVKHDPSDNTLYFKIGQIYDRNLNQKRTAIEYYERYLSEGRTDQQLFDASEGTSRALEQHVKERINKLKEELFMEE